MGDRIWRDVVAIDWHDALDPHVALLRVTRRHSGGMGMSDVLVIVLIADAVQNGMSGETRSITEGLVLALTIFFWSWLLERLPMHFPAVGPWLAAAPCTVVVDRRALRRDSMTEDELMAQLRLQGVGEIADVRRARVEANGQVSVWRRAGRPVFGSG